MDRKDIAGIILTGGHSSRMGRDKAMLEIAGRPMWQWVADALKPLVDRLFVVGAVDGLVVDPPTVVLADNPPGLGPLGGIATGIENSGKPHHLVVAVDYPLVRPGLLSLLLQNAPGHLAVCGRSQEYLEPLIAYYHVACAPVARAMLAEGEVCTHRLFERVDSYVLTDEEYRRVDPDRLSQINVNAPQDVSRVARFLLERTR